MKYVLPPVNLNEHQGNLMPALSKLAGPRPFNERELSQAEKKKKKKTGDDLPKDEFKKRYDPPPRGPASRRTRNARPRPPRGRPYVR